MSENMEQEQNDADIDDVSNLPSNVVIDINSKVRPAILANLLGYNVSLLYQAAQQGIIPMDFKNYTYKEVLGQYVRHYKKIADSRKSSPNRGGKLGGESKGESGSAALEMEELTLMKLKSDVKINIAREAQLWQKMAIEKGDYIEAEQLFVLIQPFILTIRDEISSLVIDFPEVQDRVDSMMKTLFGLGKQLAAEAKEDQTAYVQTMLDAPIDLRGDI